jgi:hypothetical protein
MINRLHIVCEGHTEQEFVNKIIIPAFDNLLVINSSLIPSSRSVRGGALVYDRVKRSLCNILKGDKNLFVTTLFDLYGLDKNFPGYVEATTKACPLETKLRILHDAMHKDIVEGANIRPERFLPYSQPHEFEALLFSDVSSLLSLEPGWKKGESELVKVLKKAESPEHINHHKDTTPSAHLKRHLKSPSYNKRVDGLRAVNKIGLFCIEQQCRFFAAWLKKLRELSGSRLD